MVAAATTETDTVKDPVFRFRLNTSVYLAGQSEGDPILSILFQGEVKSSVGFRSLSLRIGL
jgi:hypothetical protein